MKKSKKIALLCFLLASPLVTAAQQPTHEHPAPEKLGKVSFDVSCSPEAQVKFTRAVALLHSFAYAPAGEAFRAVAAVDAHCSMAYWGVAMSNYYQLWDPPLKPAELERGKAALERAAEMAAPSKREREYIDALGLIFRDAGSVPYRERVLKYAAAMSSLAAELPDDPEAQIFYALALLAAASPADRTHGNQKKAVEILEPLYARYPQHPGIAHYLIHAYDNSELAAKGLTAARDYSRIAPSAPHALHMPSHIFTRLGMWDESIASNRAARAAARAQGDTGEELHAMDYLVYAYLQEARDADAEGVLKQLREMPALDAKDFKVSYAAMAMPVRFAVERRKWDEATRVSSLEGAPPQVAAMAAWSRAIGFARSGNSTAARKEVSELENWESRLRADGNEYWAVQVRIQRNEASAWAALAEGHEQDSIASMRKAADEEDGIEKRPVTPGPIVPAREQLGDLLLQLKRGDEALREFEAALLAAPGRRGALDGALQSARLSGDAAKARTFEAALQKVTRTN